MRRKMAKGVLMEKSQREYARYRRTAEKMRFQPYFPFPAGSPPLGSGERAARSYSMPMITVIATFLAVEDFLVIPPFEVATFQQPFNGAATKPILERLGYLDNGCLKKVHAAVRDDQRRP
jgi:hypothetical protein